MILKADLHIHTHYSNNNQTLRWGRQIGRYLVDSRLSVNGVLTIAEAKRLDLTSITDHDEIDGTIKALEICKKYKLTVLPGIEITTGEGHLLAYGVKEKMPFKMGLKRTINYIKKLGGIVVAAHPFSPLGIFFMGRNKKLKEKIKLDAVEVYGSVKGFCKRSIVFAEKNKIAKLAGSDSKTKSTIGSVYTEINTANTSIDEVLKAIKNGQTKPVLIKRHSLLKQTVNLLHYNYLNEL